MLGLYVHYMENVPQAVIEANQNAHAGFLRVREEIGLLAQAIDKRNLNICCLRQSGGGPVQAVLSSEPEGAGLAVYTSLRPCVPPSRKHNSSRLNCDMKNALLEIEAILSNVVAEMSMPIPNPEKAKRGIEVARKMLSDAAAADSGRDPLLDAKRKLALVYLRMSDDKFTDADAKMFSILAKERELQAEIDRARKNN